MNIGNNGPRPVTATGRGPAVRSVLLVRLEVDRRGLAQLPRRWQGSALPSGALVRVDASRARDYLDIGGELAALVRNCAGVEVVGTDSEGVAAVQAAITGALRADVRAC